MSLSANPETSALELPELQLQELQRRFRASVLGEDDGPVLPLVAAARGPVAARIAVYRNTVQASLTEVLAVAFPVTRRVVGEQFFANLAGRFATETPPRLPQLSAYGGDFAAFIEREDVGRRLPYLADVARLEWARGEAYFAADAKPLDAARLAALSPAEMESTVFKWHPATRLTTSAFPIYRIWEVNQLDVADIPRVDMGLAQSVLVSRAGSRLVTRAVEPADAAFVRATAAGENLAEAASLALAVDAAFDLQRALGDHFITGTYQDWDT